MKMRLLSFVGALALSAAPAFAVECTFVTECFDADGCSETAFSLSIEDQGGQVNLVSYAETVPVTRSEVDPGYVYVGVDTAATHLLTRSPGGDARYSVHFYDGTFVVA